MNHNQIFKQMLDFNRSLFDKSFSAMVIWQDQVERAARVLQEQAAWIPSEGQAMVDNWVDTCKNGREEFKKTVVGSFDKAAEFIGT